MKAITDLRALFSSDDNRAHDLLDKIEEAVKRLKAAQPAVVVTVNGGIADYECTKGVKVGVIDFDSLEAGDTYDLAPWERALLSKETIEQIEKHNKNNNGE